MRTGNAENHGMAKLGGVGDLMFVLVRTSCTISFDPMLISTVLSLGTFHDFPPWKHISEPRHAAVQQGHLQEMEQKVDKSPSQMQSVDNCGYFAAWESSIQIFGKHWKNR